jgi:tight adherence protein B
MIKVIIIILMSLSAGILAYLYIPHFLRRYTQIQHSRVEKVSDKLDQMFIFSERHKIVKLFTITPLTLGLLGFILTRNLVGVSIGVALGFIFPPIIIKNMSGQRKNKFQAQLVDGLVVLSSSLKAGLSLNQAMEVLVEEMLPPISDEFSLVIKENKMGIALEDCLEHLKQRIPVDDLDLIITAINISRETGGNLTDIFSQLVFVMREKRKLEDRVRALTVQGRLQGYIMMVLPVGFGVFIYFVSPHNFDVMVKDKIGQMLLTWAVISELIGVFLINKLSKIEV